jgi:hypothetical protein
LKGNFWSSLCPPISLLSSKSLNNVFNLLYHISRTSVTLHFSTIFSIPLYTNKLLISRTI